MPIATPTVIPVRRRPWKPVIVVAVVQINVIVVDLERSRGFYERLGMEFCSRNRRGEGPAEAWVSTNTGVAVVLHSPGFASWWDETAPQPSVGGPQVDLELESVQRLDEVVAGLDVVGGTIIKRPTDMPWGQRFAIVLDPDGNRVGLKAPQV
jgi:catechol 2,3-dioxygenase-like lactoylglutathione lyase family enzyme